MADSVQTRAIHDATDWRYELKLVCDGRLLSQARSWIRLHPAGLRTAYPPRRVNNLYLDTRNLANFTANTSGLSQREKVRLRWYGDGMTVIRPILERKQKSNMLGRKVQFTLPCDLDLRWPWRESWRRFAHTSRRNGTVALSSVPAPSAAQSLPA